MSTCDLTRTIRAAVICDYYLAADVGSLEKGVRFLDANRDRFGLVEARHHDA